ncbi:hypothetical protein BD779DRAFT_1524614 [Infundibulicybe gibba]|nr:hypothetical protein BD779DRAFT_1524614 [Infundibulicybe gibba]
MVSKLMACLRRTLVIYIAVAGVWDCHRRSCVPLTRRIEDLGLRRKYRAFYTQVMSRLDDHGIQKPRIVGWRSGK